MSHASKMAPGPDGSLYVAYDELHDDWLLLGQRIDAGNLELPVTLGDQSVVAGEHLLWVDEL